MSPIRAAIVGTGLIGAVHARAIRSAGGSVVGVLGSSPMSSARSAAEWNAPKAYSDFSELIADDTVDVVHVCTPNALHVPQTEAALLAGKHVVCEKPVATSTADASRVATLANRQNLVLAVPFVYRYHPIVREIRARRIAGEFGAWQLLHGSYLQDWLADPDAWSWRVDSAAGGRSRAFADIGSHWCDLVEWVAGVRFTRVMATLATTIPKRTDPSEPSTLRIVDTEDVAAVMLQTDDGVLGSLTVSQVSRGRKNRLWFELDGTLGSAVFDQERPETAWLGDSAGARIVVRDQANGSPEQRRLSVLPAGHPQGYAECFAAFVRDTYDTISGGAPEGLPTGQDGIRSSTLIDAVLRSSDLRTWADIVPAGSVPPAPIERDRA